jgi:hypothetical protein
MGRQRQHYEKEEKDDCSMLKLGEERHRRRCDFVIYVPHKSTKNSIPV